MKNDNKGSFPPKLPLRFFKWFCHPDCLEDIEGDLLERFQASLDDYSPRKARRKFSWEIIRLCRPGIIRPISLNNPIIHPSMLRHNFLITYRSFLRDKSSFLINIIGLSTGIACALFIYLWIQEEMQMDAFHEHKDSLYQIRSHRTMRSGEIYTWDILPALLPASLEQDFPEVKAATMFSSKEECPQGVLSYGENKIVANGLFAQSNLLEVFSFPLVSGDPKQVLGNKHSIVISRALSQKLFSSPSDAIGKTLEWDNPYIDAAFTVTGVMEDLPEHSSEQFDFLMNITVFLDAHEWAKEWNGSSVETFVLLQKGVDVPHFNDQIVDHIFEKSQNPNAKGNQLFLQKYSNKYLYNRFEEGKLVGGRINNVKLFAQIGLLILLIACINFMNLSTARASVRMKQIGVKKTIGATKKELAIQFLGESTLIACLSTLLAIGLVYVLLPSVSHIAGKELTLSLSKNTLLGIGGIGLLTGLLAGSYPAFYLPRLNAQSILKGKLISSKKSLGIRKGLVILQFSLSVIFITGMLIINQQMDFTLNKNLGYSRDQVVYFQRAQQPYDLDVYLNRIKEIPGVKQVTNLHGGSVVDNKNKGTGFSWSGDPEEYELLFLRPQIGYDFFETLELTMLEGRTFSRAYADEQSKLIVNRAAAEIIGEKNIVGRIIKDGDFDKEIIGVVENFHIASLHEEMKPCIMRFSPTGYNVMVKLQAGTEQASIDQLEKLYEEYHPGYSFSFSFLDEEYQQLYESEMRVASLSQYASGLAILISCLGLLGLAAFSAEQRQKEIGIRKILGASIGQLIRLLSAEYTKMVVLAILIATPISYIIIRRWLEGFAYKIDLSIWNFVIAALVTLSIAWLTVSIQTLRATQVNPVECLKDE